MRTVIQKPLFFLLPALFLWSPLVGCGQEGSHEYPVISPEEAASRIEAEPTTVVLDVRTPEEYQSETGHIKGALLIPVQELGERLDELEEHKSQPILVYCRSGNRSRSASQLLAENGFNVTMIDGGIIEWNDAGLPVKKGGSE